MPSPTMTDLRFAPARLAAALLAAALAAVAWGPAGAQAPATPTSAAAAFRADFARHVATLDSLACGPAAGAVTVTLEPTAAELAADPTLGEPVVQRFAYGGDAATFVGLHGEVVQRGRVRVDVDHGARRVIHTAAAPPPPTPAEVFGALDPAILANVAAAAGWAADAPEGFRVYHLRLGGTLGLARAHMTYDVARERFVATRLEPAEGPAMRVAYDLAPAAAGPPADPADYVRDGLPVGPCAGYALVSR